MSTRDFQPHDWTTRRMQIYRVANQIAPAMHLDPDGTDYWAVFLTAAKLVWATEPQSYPEYTPL